MSTQSTGVREILQAGSAPAEYRRVYVWELPVRVYHWINALAITLLCATGFLIGHPMRIAFAPEAYQQYWFGWVRFIHFAAAWVFMINTLARVYWAFVTTNKHTRWPAYLPLKRWQQREIAQVVEVDLLQLKEHGHISVGHNSLAAVSYFGMFLAFIFQTVTGFALLASMSSSWVDKMFAWVVPLMGGDANVRFWHHTFLWIFVLFVIVHVYLAFYHDYIEGRGTVTAIIGGWKFTKVNSDGEPKKQ